MLSKYAYIAMNRFTYGADEISVNALQNHSSLHSAQAWLKNQLTPYKLSSPSWSSQKAIVGHDIYQRQKTKDQKNLSIMMNGKQESAVINRKMVGATRLFAQQTALANINSKQALQARLLDFFSNHFSVSRDPLPMTLLAPTLEFEAIAPHLSNHFSDMLQAVTHHPAMLLYLNNERSIGHNSKSARKLREKKNPKIRGLNENLAREILELHTLGVGSGYSQQDVVELAKAITGWSIGVVKNDEAPSYIFRHSNHEPGSRIVLGKTYAGQSRKNGDKQGDAILHDLANAPATAKHVSEKMAQHFIADAPSENLISAMTEMWLNTQGHIPSVVSAMIDHKDSWHDTAQKLKTPREFVMSACRACNITEPHPSLFKTLEILGHGMFNAGSPAGYSDMQSAWLGASALNSRIEWANHFASLIAKRSAKLGEPVDIAQFALGPLLTANTLMHVKRAESKQQALAILLMSPDFQRR